MKHAARSDGWTFVEHAFPGLHRLLLARSFSVQARLADDAGRTNMAFLSRTTYTDA